jgi:glycosyltransferase EpsH
MMPKTSSKECGITFILPIFNVDPYLEKCLDSIKQQSSSNWEAILVDDGSTDRSSAICKAYASKNPKFRYIKQDNQGQGAARNNGMKLAQGRYICFVDPDDWIEVETTRELLTLMDSSDADFANFGIDFFTEKGITIRCFNNFSKRYLNGREIFKRAMLDREIYSTPCNKIYRVAYLRSHNIQFPSLRAYEDLYFSRKLAMHARKCLFTRKIYYHALMRSGSTTRKMTKHKFTEAIKAIEIEKSALVDSNYSKNEQHLFDAHVLKLTSSLIFQAAFRIKDEREFMACIEMLRAAGLFGRLPALGVLKQLPLVNQLMAIVSCSPVLTRFVASSLSLVGVKPY